MKKGSRVSKPMWVDNSILAAMARCSTKTFVRHGLGLTTREDAAALQAGRACHLAMESWLKNGDTNAAMAALEGAYRAWAEARVEHTSRLAYANVASVMQAWFAAHDIRKLPFVVDPAMVEVGFEVPLDDDGEFVLVGRMDAVVRSRDTGGWYVHDTKTTSRITSDWVRTFDMDSQMSGYIWALQQTTGQRVIGAFVNVIELSRLPNSDRRCKQHGVAYTECGPLHARWDLFITQRTQAQLQQWRQTAIWLAQRYRDLLGAASDIHGAAKLPMEGAFGYVCRYCEFFEWCRSGRRPEVAKAVLVHDPWVPFPRMEEGNHGR